MLKKIAPRGKNSKGGRFAIVAAKYNALYTDALVASAQAELKAAGAGEIRVIRVPGSFEVTAVAGELARAKTKRYDAVICFGAILRGQTTHADEIAHAVSFGLTHIQATYGVPMIHGVLLFENEEQAKVRCLDPDHNRGIEAARTALEMSEVMKAL
jgi:6,7-dimethyl-8-ribityllumazine synthase